jgi:glycosyltransferase involved in cell wall biosynthesis
MIAQNGIDFKPIPKMVSIMMPARNAERFIAQAIESVLAQTHSNWELIVVDDGSTDDTWGIANSYADKRIRCVRQLATGGASARNAALDRIRGEFLGFLDADDMIEPDHLEGVVWPLENNPGDQGIYTDGYYISPSGSRLTPLSARRRGPFTGSVFEELVAASDVFGPPGCVVLRSAAVRSSGVRFDPNIVIGEDWDFFTKLSQFVSFRYSPQLTYLYRIHRSNITSQVDGVERSRSIARCRLNAIALPMFHSCSAMTVRAVFYDLLVNQLIGDPEQQDRIVRCRQFRKMSRRMQATILRLMAAEAMEAGTTNAYLGSWLEAATSMDPSAIKGRVLRVLYDLSPAIAQLVVRARRLQRRQSVPFPFDLVAAPAGTSAQMPTSRAR